MGGSSSHRRYRESLWRPPKQTRHVWIDRGSELPPLQGLVISWQRQSYKWSAFVVFVDDSEPPVVVQQWVRAERLKPVRANQSDLPGKGELKPPYWS